MNKSIVKSNVRQFYVYRDMEVIVMDGNIQIGSEFYNAPANYDFYVENDVLTQKDLTDETEKHKFYRDGHFIDEDCKYGTRNIHFNPDSYCSYEYNDGVAKFCFMEHKIECCYEIKTFDRFYIPRYDPKTSILIFSLWDNKTLLFYSKTGQFLWEYIEEDENLKINAGCIPIVNDVVVVICMKGNNPKKLQGFNIRSGKRIWKTEMENGVANTLFVGPDNMLYGCKSVFIKPFVSSKLLLTKINPLTGELEITNLAEGEYFEVMPWLVTMHGNKLYYTDNRRGNEIGVINVDKKELVERVPLNIKEKVTIGAPVVTDDKVYVFIRDLQELRIYEK